MINFHDFNIQAVAQYFSMHTQAIGIFTYFIVFAEAMAVIGAVVPGAVIMPAIGFLIGSGIVPAGSTFAWAIAGALTGDCLSYFIGVYFQDRIHRMWPFTRWPNLLSKSEKFFRNHGGKSIFLGRFIGPTRAMIPMIVGMLKIPFYRFILVAVPSAAIWAVSYMVPGILLGALSLELPPKVATEFTLWALLALVIIWSGVWFLHHFFKRIWKFTDFLIKKMWMYGKKRRPFSSVINFLSDPKEADSHQQLTLFIFVIISLILFGITLYQIGSGEILMRLSRAIYYLVTSVRTLFFDHVFVSMTLLGELPLLVLGSGVIFLWLLWKKHHYVAWHWFGLVFLSGVVVTAMKILIHAPRPNNIIHGMYASSFPSAHVALSLAFYGFLAVIIARELKPSRRYLAYCAAGILSLLIAFSRLYLGVHWLVDVLGGLFLGMAILIVVTISYRRRHVLHFQVNKFILVVFGVFVLVWVGANISELGKQTKKYALEWPRQSIDFKQLVQNGDTAQLPWYRINRFGRPIEAFNVVYVGDLAKISQALLDKDWESWPVTLDFRQIIESFATTSIAHHLSIFPQLYNNQRMALLFVKPTSGSNIALILRLWRSEFDLNNDAAPLWIGTVEYHHTSPYHFSLRKLRSRLPFIGATDLLVKELANQFGIWKQKCSPNQQPLEMQELQWDGKRLIIKSKS